MKKFTLITMITVIALLSSCGPSMDVSYDYNRNVDFTKFSTFAIDEWNDENSELVDEFTKERILNAMRNEMLSRGMTEAEDNPDIMLDIFVVTDIERYTTAYTTHMGMYSGWGGYRGWYSPGFGAGSYNTQFVEHEKLLGTIVLDVYDERAKKLIWQGVGKGEIDGTKRPTESTINNTISKIYYKYPIKKK
ncbi:MAG: DUF4136 domain-containing protein [Bacteroidota bacterium]